MVLGREPWGLRPHTDLGRTLARLPTVQPEPLRGSDNGPRRGVMAAGLWMEAPRGLGAVQLAHHLSHPFQRAPSKVSWVFHQSQSRGARSSSNGPAHSLMGTPHLSPQRAWQQNSWSKGAGELGLWEALGKGEHRAGAWAHFPTCEVGATLSSSLPSRPALGSKAQQGLVTAAGPLQERQELGAFPRSCAPKSRGPSSGALEARPHFLSAMLSFLLRLLTQVYCPASKTDDLRAQQAQDSSLFTGEHAEA